MQGTPATAERHPVEAPHPPRAIGSGIAQDLDQLRGVQLRSIPRPSLLAAGLRSLRGAGPKLAAAAAGAGIESLSDLLANVPHSYRDRSQLSLLAELRIGQEATAEVEVRSARLRPTRRRGLRIVEATVFDDSGPVKAVWFNQAWLAERLRPGTRLLINGKLDRNGFRVAEYELREQKGPAGEGDAGRGPTDTPGIHTQGIVPVHPATEGVRPKQLRQWVWEALPLAREEVEALPASIRSRRQLAAVADAISAAHFPADLDQVAPARERLAFEELFLHQVALAARRSGREARRPGARLEPCGPEVRGWLEALPFELTGDQRRAIEEIDGDLVSGRPMQRLLMGEVGSGKTVLALFAMLRAAECGYQAALMAPTETLAEQHFVTVERLMATAGGWPRPCELLTGSIPAGRRRELGQRLASGELGLVIGTHAVIEESVTFARLGLVVVDEQHRFGVRQRAALEARGRAAAEPATDAGNGAAGFSPHALHMTATPIPRTLSLTAYGDLDTTVLRELPAGRRPIKTWVVGEEKRAGAYEFIRARLREGRQAYVVCPLVSESEKLQAKAATVEAERLAAGELRDFEVAVLHGQMPAAEKAAAMERFVAAEADVLVATSVIEVGIDVPNAVVMLIEEADRYGLSQLHQLRGRVGRGEHESHCILFADPDSERARMRLDAIAGERDGFKLAEVDLALRGEGEVLGTRQHGLPQFRVARLPEDTALLSAARQEAVALLREHGSFEAPELGPLLDVARERFGDERAGSIPA